MLSIAVLFIAEAATRKAEPLAPKRYFSMETPPASELELEKLGVDKLHKQVQKLKADKERIAVENQKLQVQKEVKDLRARKIKLEEELGLEQEHEWKEVAQQMYANSTQAKALAAA